MLAAPDAYGLLVDPSPSQIRDIVFGWPIDDPGAKIVLPTPATLAQDEYRFSTRAGWQALRRTGSSAW